MTNKKIDYKEKYGFALVIAHIMALSNALYTFFIITICLILGKETPTLAWIFLMAINTYAWYGTRKPYKERKEEIRNKILKGD